VNPDWLMSTQGRLARIGGGTLLILIGLGLIGGFFGVILLLIGAVPIASAAYGTLLVGPLFGRDIHGRRPEDQPKEEPKDEAGDDEDDAGDDEDEAEEDDDSSRDKAERDDSARDDASDDDDARDEDSSPDDEDSSPDDEDSSADDDAPEADPDWSAPPLARAERPEGQEPRTKDLRAD